MEGQILAPNDGREYNVNGQLMQGFAKVVDFEGFFYDGIRHGWGREYKAARLLFEGQFKDGRQYKISQSRIRRSIPLRRTARKRKMYYWNGKLEYDGQFQHGRRYGVYLENGKLYYEGKHDDGHLGGIWYLSNGEKRNGKMWVYYENSLLTMKVNFVKVDFTGRANCIIVAN